MADREVKNWVTINGNHVPIYDGESVQDAFNRSVAMQNESKKERDIAKAKEQAEQLNPTKVNKDNFKILGTIKDKRFVDDITRVAQDIHNDYPEVKEIDYIQIEDKSKMGGTLGAMNGLGMLQLRSDLFNDYEFTQEHIEGLCDKGYLAGNGDFADSIVAHELAHNVDMQMYNVLMNHAPLVYKEPTTMRNEKWAEAYGRALGRKLKVDEVVSDIPDCDTSVKCFKLDGKLYSCADFNTNPASNPMISGIIVPLAINNVQKNWKKYGWFSSKPTVGQLVHQLSGYVFTNHYNTEDIHGKDFNTEVFAESYINYKAYGTSANILAQEVMRLTNQLYSNVTSTDTNGVKEFYERLYSK